MQHERMKALSLHGAWASFAESKEQNEARIRQLERELSVHKQLADEREAALHKTQQEKAALQQQQDLQQEEHQRARSMIVKLDAELRAQQEAAAASQQELTMQLSSSQQKVQALAAESLHLKNELAKTIQARHATRSNSIR